MTAEKRKHERVDFHADVTIRCSDRTIMAEVVNISRKGLFVQTDQNLPLKAAAELVLYFYGSSSRLSFTIPATVVRIEEGGIAFSFEYIDMASLFMHQHRSSTAKVSAATMDEFLDYMDGSLTV